MIGTNIGIIKKHYHNNPMLLCKCVKSYSIEGIQLRGIEVPVVDMRPNLDPREA